jgi:DNA helicase-2/ATP-dependent DNA helicase PcrA
MDLETALSPAQFEAATTLREPVCILAGAGSGKTRVVTHRIAHLIEDKDQFPWTILAVTFTNKAAGEMRHRVDELVPGKGRDVMVGTFHGMAARFLRKHGASVGVQQGFVIYDADDAKRLLKRVCVEELNWNKDVVRPIMHYIEGWQAEGLLPTELPEAGWNPFEQKAQQAYGMYVERLAGMGALDFGGLLVKLRDLLRLPVGEDLKRRVRHLLVDEYQDTNRVQAEITLALAEGARSVAVVGDDDQAIYGWRGASADNLKHFLDKMPEAKLVRLEDNYRSTRHILDAANGVIENNAARLGKVLRATGDEGQRVQVLKAHNDVDEARRVVSSIQELGRVRSLEDIAVLYRTNAMSRAFEDELRRLSLPYRVVGGVRFYDRKEVKDVLATVRCALNPLSDVDTARMIAAVPRGIGDTSVQKIQRSAVAAGGSVLGVMQDSAALEAAGVAKRVRSKAGELAAKIAELGTLIDPAREEHLDAREAIALAIDRSGVADRLEAEGTVEAEGRLENLGELLNAAAQFVADMRELGQPAHVLGFLEQASLLAGTESEETEGEAREKVTLMTLHAAKGLEYTVVFLVGLEEHGFPHSRALAEDAPASELEEERRLAYVGITRARERLTMSWAQRRMVQGAVRPRTPSRFLRELPEGTAEGDGLPRSRAGLAFSPGFFDDGADVRAARGGFGSTSAGVDYDDPAIGGAPRLRRRSRRRVRGTLPDDDEPTFDPSQPHAVPKAPGALADSQRVRHASFGEGTIIGFRGVGNRRAALVRFDDARAPRVIIERHLQPVTEDAQVVEPVVVYDEVEPG